MQPSVQVDGVSAEGDIVRALNRAADILAPDAGRADIASVSVSGRLRPDAGSALALLRLAEGVAAGHHLRQRVHLSGDAFVVTLSAADVA